MKKRLFTALAALMGMLLLSASIVWAQPAPVAKTGQTESEVYGDDGYVQNGVAWPSPRFIDHGDGTVRDNLTGLMWAKDANMGGSMLWRDAIDYANNLSLGTACGGPLTDWRMPNVRELHSLIDFSNFNVALPSDHPFLNVQSTYYWSSTTYIPYTADVFTVQLFNGDVYRRLKSDVYSVWPVRGGN